MKVTMLNFMQECAQFFFESGQVNHRRRAAFEFRNLAINAAPVAGIVGIEIDAYRYAAGAA